MHFVVDLMHIVIYVAPFFKSAYCSEKIVPIHKRVHGVILQRHELSDHHGQQSAVINNYSGSEEHGAHSRQHRLGTLTPQGKCNSIFD